MQGDKVPQERHTQVSPTSSPRGMTVEQHITATSIHTITTTIVRTPQTVDGPRIQGRWSMVELSLCPLPRGCSVQSSVSGHANKEPLALPLHIHGIANGTRLTTLLPGLGASNRYRAGWPDHLGLNEFVQVRLAAR